MKTPAEKPKAIDIDVASSPAVVPNIILGTNGHAGFSYPTAEAEGAYKIKEQYHSKPAKLRVAGIGAGASGKYP